MGKTRIAMISLLAVVALVAGGATVAVAAARGDDVALSGTELEQASAAALEHTGEGEVTDTEAGDEDEGGFYEVEVTLADGRQVEVQLDQDFKVVGEELDDDSDEDDGDEQDEQNEQDEQVTGPRADAAGAAALEAAGGGTVIGVEAADEGESGYEVDVQLEDGSFVEVELDADLTVLSTEKDD